MAIEFPRPLPPELKFVGLQFYLDPLIEVTPLRSGRQISADLGPSLWRAKYQSPPVDMNKLGEIRAWYDTLMSIETFYGYDASREYPRAYANGWPEFSDKPDFDGTCVLAAVATNNKQIALSGLPRGFILSPGDYVAWDYSNDTRALHRVSVGGSSDTSGLLNIEVRPYIRVGFTAGQTIVMLYRPAAKMIIVPNTYSDPIDINLLGRVAFEAVQTL